MENTSVHSLADEISPLTLAFVGDGVYDLLVREYLVRKANRSVGEPKCTPKNGSVADYHSATGLEALFGYLQINKEFDRINQLFEIIIHTRFVE